MDEKKDSRPEKFSDGSVRIALEVKPEFDAYFFIEKDRDRFKELEKLKTEFPEKASRIYPRNEDANIFLKKICRKNWKYNRAVVFLDPFGMQVTWETLTYIAETKAIDLWLLFPLGSAVSRMLKVNGQITHSWEEKLNAFFGDNSWYDQFYQPAKQGKLFGESDIEKVATFETISAYFMGRLKEIFPEVSEQPLWLTNSKNNPLFLLCFAASSKVALKVANSILRGKRSGK